MADDLKFLKCRRCHGMGKILETVKTVGPCPDCDGTGNAFVSGEDRRYQRMIEEVERQQKGYRSDG